MGLLLEIVTFGIQQLKLRIDPVNETQIQINQSKPLVDNSVSEVSLFKATALKGSKSINVLTRAYIAMAFLVQLFLAYTIMLIVMTFNFLLFLAPVFGMVAGFFANSVLWKLHE